MGEAVWESCAVAMGVEPNIGPDRYPRQGVYLGRKVRVCFDYDVTACLLGEVIRDDAQAPGRMVIRLDNGWVVLSTECQWQPV